MRRSKADANSIRPPHFLAAAYLKALTPLLAARTHTERTTMEAAFLESGTNVDKVRGAIRFVSGFWEKEQGTASKGAIPLAEI